MTQTFHIIDKYACRSTAKKYIHGDMYQCTCIAHVRAPSQRNGGSTSTRSSEYYQNTYKHHAALVYTHARIQEHAVVSLTLPTAPQLSFGCLAG